MFTNQRTLTEMCWLVNMEAAFEGSQAHSSVEDS